MLYYKGVFAEPTEQEMAVLAASFAAFDDEKEMKKMDASKYYVGSGNRLSVARAKELGLIGKRLKLKTITDEEFEEEDGSKVLKPILGFENIEPNMVVNKTNWGTIRMNWGDDTDKWLGREISLSIQMQRNGQPGLIITCV